MFRDVVDHARARRGVALMGICNVTPDSFSDGGRYTDTATACARVDEILAEGADIVDIGAESTRPGAAPVSVEEQLRRALGIVRYAASKRACVSIDTTHPDVASACLDAGASAVNDTSCLADARLAQTAAEHRSALVLMHARGTPSAMRGFSEFPDDGYRDVVADVLAEWNASAARACAAGLARDALVMDPGLGFAKNKRHSRELLSRVDVLVRSVDVPVLVGASRKSFLSECDPDAGPAERIGASIAAAIHAVRLGVAVVRVHDVRATRQAIDSARQFGSL
jgi:dihydropteroate synthase